MYSQTEWITNVRTDDIMILRKLYGGSYKWNKQCTANSGGLSFSKKPLEKSKWFYVQVFSWETGKYGESAHKQLLFWGQDVLFQTHVIDFKIKGMLYEIIVRLRLCA